jgi:acyl-CoA synthetase (AMP-forming)/AMP-acid ligase II
MVESRWTLPQLLQRALDEFPDAEALVDGDSRWTFRDLVTNVRRTAAAMIADGVRPGDRVAVWAPNGHRWVMAALGAVSAGAVLVPVSTRYKSAEAQWILRKSGATVLVVDDGFLGNDYLAMLGDHTLRTIVSMRPSTTALAWDEFLAGGEHTDPDEAAASIGPEDLCDMFFTSGTTGLAKGVIAAHHQTIAATTAWCDGVGLKQADRYLVTNPMFHTFGYKAGILAGLVRGATLISLPVFDVDEVLDLIERERITVYPGPPTIYVSLLDHPRRPKKSTLRLAVTGATIVPAALVERMRAELLPDVIVAYGLTETCGMVSICDPASPAEVLSRTVGKPIPGVEVQIWGPQGAPAATGEPGEVMVRGFTVMRGYYEDPEATAAAITPEGWLHTGDIGLIGADGNLRITDRLKDMYTTGGFNVYPAEVEQVLAAHAAVAEVAVIGVPDYRLGEVGKALVVPRPGAALPAASTLTAFCRERLAGYKVPAQIQIVASLPKNAAGKVRKDLLRDDRDGPNGR